jgi:hypothetical protein
MNLFGMNGLDYSCCLNDHFRNFELFDAVFVLSTVRTSGYVRMPIRKVTVVPSSLRPSLNISN